MKKWFLIIAILFLPMCLFAVMSSVAENKGNLSDSLAAFAQAKPKVYKFSSSMCMDCQQLEKILKEIKPQYEDKINFIGCNVDKNDKKVQELIKKYNITLVPTMVLVNQAGEDKLKIEGLLSKEEIEKHLKVLINE